MEPPFAPVVRASTRDLFRRATEFCDSATARSRAYLSDHAQREGLDPSKICYVTAGSFGRTEALAASDFDLVPVVSDEASLAFLSNDAKNAALRTGLSAALGGLDVSRGRSVMGVVQFGDLVDPLRIGGDGDDRIGLTRRMIILTESIQAGGELPLTDVRRAILEAYTKRTAGRHPLAFCNDLARYYRTLCIDYKAKVDKPDNGDWAEKNAKLRHSRKFWYFSSALATSAIAEAYHPDNPEFVDRLLAVLKQSPSLRLFEAAGERCRAAVGRLLDQYAWYLDFMSDAGRRAELRKVDHASRYAAGSNPYAVLQWSSKVLHSAMLSILDQVDQGVRDRVIEWFLL